MLRLANKNRPFPCDVSAMTILLIVLKFVALDGFPPAVLEPYLDVNAVTQLRTTHISS